MWSWRNINVLNVQWCFNDFYVYERYISYWFDEALDSGWQKIDQKIIFCRFFWKRKIFYKFFDEVLLGKRAPRKEGSKEGGGDMIERSHAIANVSFQSFLLPPLPTSVRQTPKKDPCSVGVSLSAFPWQSQLFRRSVFRSDGTRTWTRPPSRIRKEGSWVAQKVLAVVCIYIEKRSGNALL